MCDLDDHYKFNHSLGGNCPIGFADIMLFSFLRREKGISEVQFLVYLTTKTNVKLMNLFRVMSHLNNKLAPKHEAMDKKEDSVLDNMLLLTS